MAVQKTNPNHALKPGTEAWFLPQKDNSLWAKKLDWLLNFQISKIQSKKNVQIANEIKQILSEQEINWIPTPVHKNGILISSQDYLPTQHIIILNTDDINIFLNLISEYSNMLNLESVRVFLPNFISTQDFIKNWEHTSPRKVSLVEDLSS